MFRATGSVIGHVRVAVAVALALACTTLLIVGAPTVTSAADVTVTINNFAFTPGTITVPVGARVVWTNQQAGVSHTTTSDTGVWDSGRLATGQSFAVTFTQPGTFPYHCSIHPGMQGTITVVAQTAPVAVADSYTFVTGTTLTVPAAIGVLTNDDPGNPAAALAVATQPTHGALALNIADGSFIYTPVGGYVGSDAFTYTLTNSVGASTGAVSLTITAATVTGLTTVAPAANGGAAPMMPVGSSFTLMTTGMFSNGTTGAVIGLMYASSNPGIATVDPATGLVTALTGGQTTIIVTAPNPAPGSPARTQITVIVTGAAGSGLVPPAVQPGTHLDVPIAHVTIAPQPTPHPTGAGTGTGGAQPQAAGAPTATPNVQPGRH